MSLFAPIIIVLKGTYLLAWVVSLFSIMSMLAVKTNDYMVKKYDLNTLYKSGVIIHVLIVLSACLYFTHPIIMVWLDSSIVIIETAVFSAYSILLNNYITDEHPNSMSRFQIVRNSSWADGALIGLGITTIITFFLPLDYAVLFFIVYNSIFSMWMMKNWNFYKINVK